MRAWLMHDYSGIENLRLAEVPDPVPNTGEVVLSIRYAGLNPADRYLAEKQYPARPSLPHVLGRDGLGTVAALGPGVNGLSHGERLAVARGDTGGDRPGTFAQYVAIPSEDLVSVPENWTDEEGAGATLVYLTAFQALTMWGELPPNAVVLITGASGGVGTAAVQLASAMRLGVVGLSRNAEKRDRLRALGARWLLDPADHDWRKSLKAELGSARVDLAIDNVGGRLLPQVIDTLGMHGRVSVVGRLAGPVPEFNTATLFFRRLRIGGVAVGTYSKAESRAAWQEVLQLLAASGARPVVDSVFEFERLPEAFARLAEGPMGKVLLRVGA